MWEERNIAELMENADLKYARLQNIKTLQCCGLERIEYETGANIRRIIYVVVEISSYGYRRMSAGDTERSGTEVG